MVTIDIKPQHTQEFEATKKYWSATQMIYCMTKYDLHCIIPVPGSEPRTKKKRVPTETTMMAEK